jgi:FMN-dependent NADH-azoreductase
LSDIFVFFIVWINSFIASSKRNRPMEVFMSTLLQINSSVFSQGGQSSQLADHYVAAWKKNNPTGKIVSRDLAASPIPHLGGATVGAFFTPADKRTAEQQAAIALSDELVAEIQAADVVVIGAPMYNFNIPSVLKAWFDHIARAGITFKYTEQGPVGLLTGKKAVVFSTRGGLYAGTPSDVETPFVRQFLGFLGITDVNFVYAEGLAYGEDKKAEAMKAAKAETERLAA